VEEKVKLRVLVIVKAYPEPSITHGSTVCVAGVTVPEGRWVRLYPVRYVRLPKDRQFAKYQPIDVDTVKAEKDPRPESYRVDEESIRLVGDPIETKRGWAERKMHLANATFSSLCELQRVQRVEGASLGMVRAREVLGFRRVEADEEKFRKAAAEAGLRRHQLSRTQIVTSATNSPRTYAAYRTTPRDVGRAIRGNRGIYHYRRSARDRERPQEGASVAEQADKTAPPAAVGRVGERAASTLNL